MNLKQSNLRRGLIKDLFATIWLSVGKLQQQKRFSIQITKFSYNESILGCLLKAAFFCKINTKNYFYC
jgi:hypothetical protein